MIAIRYLPNSIAYRTEAACFILNWTKSPRMIRPKWLLAWFCFGQSCLPWKAGMGLRLQNMLA